MVLSAQTIQKYCLQQEMIYPFINRTSIDGLSAGLSSNGYDIRISQPVELQPKEFVLGSTIESFRMPNNIMGVVHDKSTLARIGLTVQNTIIESGWTGKSLTLELFNNSNKTINLLAGSPIAQVVFHFLDEPTTMPYLGKYNNAPEGIQQAIFDF